MFASGVVKLTSGDPTWRDLGTLALHYETQPLPVWTSWWMHQLPDGVHRASTAGALAIECLAPLLYLGPRRARLLGAGLTTALMLLIALTGSYGFFNLLTLVLCIALLDDRALPARLRRRLPARPEDGPRLGPRHGALALVAVWLAVAGLAPLFAAFRVPPPDPLLAVYGAQRGAHVVSSYGLFATMTTERPEIDVQGAGADGVWRSYGFPYKPGDLERRPRFAGAHMPRLDWQLWFAALRGADRVRWLRAFGVALLEGRPDVRALLRHDPFPDAPPRELRVIVQGYRFTGLGDGSSAWWRTEGPARVAFTMAARR